MIDPPAYDALDTVRWMLEEAHREIDSEVSVLADGRTKKKTKAQRNDDRVRFDTLCTVIWNVTGRVEPLEAITVTALAACVPPADGGRTSRPGRPLRLRRAGP